MVLGYLLAGVLVGPEISFLPTVQDREGVKIWAELGIIILLFTLGLEFSFRKLLSVGRGASITAVTEVFCMFGLGYLIGRAFGWNEMDSVFLGGILSISSTTIIIRAIEELNLKRRRFVGLVFGALIVEDLVAILLMVVLSTIAVSKTVEGMQVINSAAKLGFFLTLWFLGGIFLLPWFLRKIRPLMNDESSLIVSLGLCLLMVTIATKSGFSPALGAFIMGSILAETPDGERIEKSLHSVRTLFSAVFFVSVGMLLDLTVLREQWLAVIVITLATIVGKVLSTSLGALLAGERLRHSVQAGFSLAQIGEFSFIIATLGVTLKVTSDFLYPLAVAVSVVTTFTTPYLIKFADPFYRFLESKLPPSFMERFDRADEKAVATPIDSSTRVSGLRLFFNSVVVIGIGLAASVFLEPALEPYFPSDTAARYASLAASISVALPFLWAIVADPGRWKIVNANPEIISAVAARAVIAFIVRALIAGFLLVFIVSRFTSAVTSLFAFGAIAIGVGILGFKNFARIYDWLESRFINHLNEKELESLREMKQRPALAPWDAHLAELTVNPDAEAVGKTLTDLCLRETVGVTIALIERGRKQIAAPRGDTILMPNDKVFAIGTEDQLQNLSRLLEVSPSGDAHAPAVYKYGLSDFYLTAESRFAGKTIRESGLREETDGLIVGIEREQERILNPESTMRLLAGDRLWIVGNSDRVAHLTSN